MPPCNKPHQQPAPVGDITVDLPPAGLIWKHGEYAQRIGGPATLTVTLAEANALFIELAKQINTASAYSAMTTEGDRNRG
jgi:hypothetical protein